MSSSSTGCHPVPTSRAFIIPVQIRLALSPRRDVSGGGVPGARAVLLGTGVEGVANSAGRFVLDRVPPGSFTLEIRSIGYTPVRRLVHVLDGRGQQVTMALGAKIFTLPTEFIRGELVYSRQLEGFERRRRTRCTGKFLGPRDLQDRPRARIAAVLQGVQGVEVTQRGPNSLIVMRGGAAPGREYCTPSLYVDGLRDLTDDFDRLWTDELAAIEVYPRAAQRPFEFTDRNECGAIAVWLRPRPSVVR